MPTQGGEETWLRGRGEKRNAKPPPGGCCTSRKELRGGSVEECLGHYPEKGTATCVLSREGGGGGGIGEGEESPLLRLEKRVLEDLIPAILLFRFKKDLIGQKRTNGQGEGVLFKKLNVEARSMATRGKGESSKKRYQGGRSPGAKRRAW